jgi:hypothetical protein
MSSTYLLRTHTELVYFVSFPEKGYGVVAPHRIDGVVATDSAHFKKEDGSVLQLNFDGIPMMYTISDVRNIWRVLMYNGFVNAGKVLNSPIETLDANG